MDELVTEIKSKFPIVFSEGLGRCNKMRVSLTLKQGTRPVFRKARPVPYAAATAIAKELGRLQHLGVITPVEYSNSAAPIVAVKKKDGRT